MVPTLIRSMGRPVRLKVVIMKIEKLNMYESFIQITEIFMDITEEEIDTSSL